MKGIQRGLKQSHRKELLIKGKESGVGE